MLIGPFEKSHRNPFSYYSIAIPFLTKKDHLAPTQNRDFPPQKGWVETTFSHSFSLSPAVMRRYARRRSSQVYPKQRPWHGTAGQLRIAVPAVESTSRRRPVVARIRGARSQKIFWCVRACVCVCRACVDSGGWSRTVVPRGRTFPPGVVGFSLD